MTPGELKAKAQRKLKDVYRSLVMGEQVFPLLIPLAKPRTTASLNELRDFIHTVRSQSKEQLGYGYTIEEKNIRTRQHGKNAVPQRLTFESESDYLNYVGAMAEASRLMENVGILCSHFPSARKWCAFHLPFMLREKDTVVFAIRVVEYLKANPSPGCFARQLPIAVPSKFIESNRHFVESLLREVAPESFVEVEGGFEESVGLLTKESLIEFRSLDSRCGGLPFSHSMATARELASRQELFRDFENVLIIENHVPFLTAPILPKTLAIMGSGYAVKRLAGMSWLYKKRTFYWGDIDLSGFAILAKLRESLPAVRSLMMDVATFEKFSDFQNRHDAAQQIPAQAEALLNEDERKMVGRLKQSAPLRLEQEHIEFSYLVGRLETKLGWLDGTVRS